MSAIFANHGPLITLERLDAAPASQSPVLCVRTFGMFAVLGSRGWEAGPPPKKGGELLQLLVANPTSVVTQDQAAALLPPDLTPETMAHRLHLAASGARAYLRRYLGGLDAIRCVGRGYAWREGIVVNSDMAMFLECHRRGTIESLLEGVALYQGDFLAGEVAEWLLPIRVRCSSMYVAMLERLAETAFDERRFSDALQDGLLLIAVDRSHEGASRLVMRCFSALGRRSSVVAEYEALKAFLRKNFGADPTPETRQIYYSLIG